MEDTLVINCLISNLPQSPEAAIYEAVKITDTLRFYAIPYFFPSVYMGDEIVNTYMEGEWVGKCMDDG